jgi:hypothetical protein
MAPKDLDDQPRSLVAYQQMTDLFLVALLSVQTDRETVMARFRKLVYSLTADTSLIDDQSFVTAVQRAAARFDQSVDRLSLATDAVVSLDAAKQGLDASPQSPTDLQAGNVSI